MYKKYDLVAFLFYFCWLIKGHVSLWAVTKYLLNFTKNEIVLWIALIVTEIHCSDVSVKHRINKKCQATSLLQGHYQTEHSLVTFVHLLLIDLILTFDLYINSYLLPPINEYLVWGWELKGTVESFNFMGANIYGLPIFYIFFSCNFIS